MPISNLYGRTTASPYAPQASGRYYVAGQSGVTTVAIAANTLYAAPILIPRQLTFTSINMEVTTLSAGNLRLGIYKDKYMASGATDGGYPDVLVLDAGTVNTGTTGGKAVSISQLLDPGWYWLAAVANATPTVRSIGTTVGTAWLGMSSTTDSNIHHGVSVAFTYAALPNPFTGGFALVNGGFIRMTLGV